MRSRPQTEVKKQYLRKSIDNFVTPYKEKNSENLESEAKFTFAEP